MMQKTYPMVKAIALKFANTIIILQTVETAKKKNGRKQIFPCQKHYVQYSSRYFPSSSSKPFA